MLFRRTIFSFFLFLFLVPSGVALIPQTAEAAAFGLVPCALENDDQSTSWDERGPCTLCHFILGMQRIVTFLRNVMTAIAVAVIVAMSIVYIVSAGNEGMMSMAKKGIIASLIGFAVILLAWVIVNFIFTLPIFSNTGLVRTTGWDTFTCNTTSQVNAGNTTVARSSSSISNASGSSVNTGPGRVENAGPGTQPPTTGGGTGGSGGGTGGGGGGTDPGTGGSGPGIFTPKCGGVHYTCDDGTPINTQELTDRWTWLCQKDWNSKFCVERFEGCGDGKVGGMTQYGALEQCDEGARNDDCTVTGTICSAGYCSRCDGNYTPPINTWGCGPSNGTPNPPSGELCTGGSTASAVQESAIGSARRYDWTCSKEGFAGVANCSSGAISSGGNQTATCGAAATQSWATAPTDSDGLCATGTWLSIYGVTPLVTPDGRNLWYWSCAFGAGVDGHAATSCYAPNISGGSGGGSSSCQASTYSWNVGGVNCNSSYGNLTNGALTRVTDNDGETWGSAGIRCINGGVSSDTSFGPDTCTQTTRGATCGSFQATRPYTGGAIAPVSGSLCSEGYSDVLLCDYPTPNSISCNWLCRAQTGQASVSCAGSATVP